MIEHRATEWKLMRGLPYHGDLEVRIWFRKWDGYPYVEQRHEWRSPNGGEYHNMQEWIKSCIKNFPDNSFPIDPMDDVVFDVIQYLKDDLKNTNDPDKMDKIEDLLRRIE